MPATLAGRHVIDVDRMICGQDDMYATSTGLCVFDVHRENAEKKLLHKSKFKQTFNFFPSIIMYSTIELKYFQQLSGIEPMTSVLGV